MSNWTPDEIELIADLREAEWTYREIAEYMTMSKDYTSRSRDAVKKFAQRNANKTTDDKIYNNKAALHPKLEAKFKNTFKEIRELRDSYMEVFTEKFVKIGRPVNATKKILAIGDLHGPFFNRFVIDHAIKNHGDADILVITGDLFDCFAVSKWPRSKEFLLKWEYQIVIELIKMFVSIFPKVVLISGNHENRLSSMFSARIDPQVSFLTSPDLLKRVQQGYDFTDNDEFEQVHDWGGKVVYDGGQLKWYTKIGQALFVHPSKGYSTVPLANVLKASKYFKSREEFQCICFAHTHQVAMCIHEGKLLFDHGAGCLPMDYEGKGDLMYSGQSFGYGLVYLNENGDVCFQKSGPVYLGTGSAIKADDPLRLL